MPKCDVPMCDDRRRITKNGKIIECLNIDTPTKCAMYRMYQKYGLSILKYKGEEPDTDRGGK